jgi:hypothetical protein
MKLLDYKKTDAKFAKLMRTAEDRILVNTRAKKAPLKNGVEIAAYYKVKPAALEDKDEADSLVDRVVGAFIHEIDAKQDIQRISQMYVIPNHEPRTLSAGYVVYFLAE